MITKKTIDVYWASSSGQKVSDLLVAPPTFPALSSFSANKFSEPALIRCPAVRDYYQNSFCLKSPIGLTIQANGDIIPENVVNRDIPHADLFQGTRGNVIQFIPDIYFFCEQECNVELLHPCLADNDVANKTYVISGTFDISKWYRSIHPAFYRADNVEVTIKEGDVLAYIKFKTPHRINFVEHTVSQELDSILHHTSLIKDRNTSYFKSISKYYEAFERRHYRKRILKEIKANIV